jgi:hypothetical protein
MRYPVKFDNVNLLNNFNDGVMCSISELWEEIYYYYYYYYYYKPKGGDIYTSTCLLGLRQVTALT